MLYLSLKKVATPSKRYNDIILTKTATQNIFEDLDSTDLSKAAYRVQLNKFKNLVDQVNHSSTASYTGAPTFSLFSPAFSLYKKSTDKQNLLNTLVQKLQSVKFSSNPVFNHQELFSTVISMLMNEDDKAFTSLSLDYPSIRNWHKEPELNYKALADWDKAKRYNSGSPFLKLPNEILTQIFRFLEDTQALTNTSSKLRNLRLELPLALTLRKSEQNPIEGFFETKFSKLQTFASDCQNLAQIPAKRLEYFLWHHPKITSLSFRRSSLTTDQLSTILKSAKNLTSIDLSENNLSKISAEMWKTFFDNHPKITSLSFSESSLTTDQLSTILKSAKNLTSIDLSENNLSEIPHDTWKTFFDNNPNLKRFIGCSLSLTTNKLRTILESAKNLTSIDLSENNLYEISADTWKTFFDNNPNIKRFIGCRLFERLDSPNLTSIDLSETDLSEISDAMWQTFFNNTPNLERLILRGCRLWDLPASLEQLIHLTDLDLSHNELGENGDSIPPELLQLTQLRHLDLACNTLSGKIPPWIGQLTELLCLDLSDNQLSDNIPSEIGQLTQLTELNLSRNELSGNIPSEIRQLTELIRLDLSHNELGENGDSIPPKIGQLKKLTELNLSHNTLRGPFPSEIRKLTRLICLDLSDNQLTGNIPAELGNLIHLSKLDLSSNQLTGNIPAELGNLTHLSKLDLSSNQLTGNIPAELGNLTHLSKFDLSSNQLTGNIPNWLKEFTQLTVLDLNSNQLTGAIPDVLGSLSQLTRLYLGANQLTGAIPASLDSLSQLKGLCLAANQLTGNIPASLGKLTRLENLFLGNNQLTGTIAASLGNMTQLYELKLSDNQLTGTIPASLGNTRLTEMDLSNNQLTGPFPSSLIQSFWFKYANLRGNNNNNLFPDYINRWR